MPKRGSSTSSSVSTIPRKRQKNVSIKHEHNDDEHEENTPMEYDTYASQLFKKSPDVSFFIHLSLQSWFILRIFSSCIKMLVPFFE